MASLFTGLLAMFPVNHKTHKLNSGLKIISPDISGI
jgi:hypothetical protein